MTLPSEAELLRIYIGESDKRGRRALYGEIVAEARQRGLAGATVLHGVAGFGASSRLHTASILRLSEDLPVVVEIVDRPERIDEFLPFVEEVIRPGGGLVTREKVRIIAYRHGSGGSPAP